MVLANRRALKQAASDVLRQRRGEAKRLILLYAGIEALFYLAIAVLDVWLRQQIAGTSGLGGVGTRSILQTAQQVLGVLAQILPVFWGMGYLSGALRLSRGQDVEDRSLLQGFREFGPVLRLMLLDSLIILAVVVVGCFVGVFALIATPLGTPFVEAMAPLMGETDLTVIDDATLLVLSEAMVPLKIGCLVICGLLILPVMFRLRFAEYLLLDDPASGAIMAILRSFKLTKRRAKKLLALDLGFWWYYLALVAVSLVSQGDVLLGYLGVALPMTQTEAYFLFFGGGLLLQFAAAWFFRNPFELAWIQVYEQLRQAPAEPPKIKREKLPWNDPFTNAN